MASIFTRYLDLAAKGLRSKRPRPVHHTPQLNGRTGQPHTSVREKARRVNQRRAASVNLG
jgi:hypothetical protein